MYQIRGHLPRSLSFGYGLVKEAGFDSQDLEAKKEAVIAEATRYNLVVFGIDTEEVTEEETEDLGNRLAKVAKVMDTYTKDLAKVVAKVKQPETAITKDYVQSLGYRLYVHCEGLKLETRQWQRYSAMYQAISLDEAYLRLDDAETEADSLATDCDTLVYLWDNNNCNEHFDLYDLAKAVSDKAEEAFAARHSLGNLEDDQANASEDANGFLAEGLKAIEATRQAAKAFIEAVNKEGHLENWEDDLWENTYSDIKAGIKALEGDTNGLRAKVKPSVAQVIEELGLGYSYSPIGGWFNDDTYCDDCLIEVVHRYRGLGFLTWEADTEDLMDDGEAIALIGYFAEADYTQVCVECHTVILEGLLAEEDTFGLILEEDINRNGIQAKAGSLLCGNHLQEAGFDNWWSRLERVSALPEGEEGEVRWSSPSEGLICAMDLVIPVPPDIYEEVVKGSFQGDLLAYGHQAGTLSLASLNGLASDYVGKYQASRDNFLARMAKAFPSVSGNTLVLTGKPRRKQRLWYCEDSGHLVTFVPSMF